MKDPHVIYESPSKTNIAYSVLYMDKDRAVKDYFQWLVGEITEKKIKATRTIIYCQTTKQCGTITLKSRERNPPSFERGTSYGLL